MRPFIVFGLRVVSRVPELSPLPSSKSGLEYGLEVAALFPGVPRIAIIVASGS